MLRALSAALLAACLLAPPHALAAGAEFAQPSMNIYRRFPAELHDKMIGFYQKVLGLKPLAAPPVNLGPGQEVYRFTIGSGQIKLASGLMPDRQYHLGALNEATGARVLTFTFPDEAELVGRFRAEGYPAPAFKDIGPGRRGALLKDPAGFWLELVVLPGAPPQAYERVEIGINAADLKRSKSFYRDFLGLDEAPPEKDPLLGLTKHSYRHGETTVSLWSVGGRGLPADTDSAGIQYVIGNIEAIDARAKAAHVLVQEPLAVLPRLGFRTLWLNDPDGVTNYFYQLGPRPAAR